MTDMQSAEMKHEVGGHWRLFLAEGLILIVLGAAAIVIPPLATIAVAVFLGWVFLVVGTVGLAMVIAGRGAPGFWWALLSAVVTIAAGAALLGWPVIGAISLTFVLTAYLIADGIITMLFAYEHRSQLPQRWVFVFINGVLDLVLAAIIVLALPQSSLWALGLIVGIDLVFGGFSLVAMALADRKFA
jgi:uncharacterized membrane protein HdeD (DUF308 family)